MDLSALAASMGLSSVNVGNAVKEDLRRARKPSDRSDSSNASTVSVTLDVSEYERDADATVRVTLDVSAFENAPPAL